MYFVRSLIVLTAKRNLYTVLIKNEYFNFYKHGRVG